MVLLLYVCAFLHRVFTPYRPPRLCCATIALSYQHCCLRAVGRHAAAAPVWFAAAPSPAHLCTHLVPLCTQFLRFLPGLPPRATCRFLCLVLLTPATPLMVSGLPYPPTCHHSPTFGFLPFWIGSSSAGSFLKRFAASPICTPHYACRCAVVTCVSHALPHSQPRWFCRFTCLCLRRICCCLFCCTHCPTCCAHSLVCIPSQLWFAAAAPTATHGFCRRLVAPRLYLFCLCAFTAVYRTFSALVCTHASHLAAHPSPAVSLFHAAAAYMHAPGLGSHLTPRCTCTACVPACLCYTTLYPLGCLPISAPPHHISFLGCLLRSAHGSSPHYVHMPVWFAHLTSLPPHLLPGSLDAAPAGSRLRLRSCARTVFVHVPAFTTFTSPSSACLLGSPAHTLCLPGFVPLPTTHVAAHHRGFTFTTRTCLTFTVPFSHWFTPLGSHTLCTHCICLDLWIFLLKFCTYAHLSPRSPPPLPSLHYPLPLVRFWFSYTLPSVRTVPLRTSTPPHRWFAPGSPHCRLLVHGSFRFTPHGSFAHVLDGFSPHCVAPPRFYTLRTHRTTSLHWFLDWFTPHCLHSTRIFGSPLSHCHTAISCTCHHTTPLFFTGSRFFMGSLVPTTARLCHAPHMPASHRRHINTSAPLVFYAYLGFAWVLLLCVSLCLRLVLHRTTACTCTHPRTPGSPPASAWVGCGCLPLPAATSFLHTAACHSPRLLRHHHLFYCCAWFACTCFCHATGSLSRSCTRRCATFSPLYFTTPAGFATPPLVWTTVLCALPPPHHHCTPAPHAAWVPSSPAIAPRHAPPARLMPPLTPPRTCATAARCLRLLRTTEPPGFTALRLVLPLGSTIPPVLCHCLPAFLVYRARIYYTTTTGFLWIWFTCLLVLHTACTPHRLRFSPRIGFYLSCTPVHHCLPHRFPPARHHLWFLPVTRTAAPPRPPPAVHRHVCAHLGSHIPLPFCAFWFTHRSHAPHVLVRFAVTCVAFWTVSAPLPPFWVPPGFCHVHGYCHLPPSRC